MLLDNLDKKTLKKLCNIFDIKSNKKVDDMRNALLEYGQKTSKEDLTVKIKANEVLLREKISLLTKNEFICLSPIVIELCDRIFTLFHPIENKIVSDLFETMTDVNIAKITYPPPPGRYQNIPIFSDRDHLIR